MPPLVPPGARPETAALDGGRVRVLRSPAESGPAVLLLHGGGCDNASISWYRVFEPLGTAFRLIAPDLPGSGSTSGIAPLGGPAPMADFTARLMTVLGEERAVVAGVSMGGDVALNLALRHPDRVRALIPIAPAGLSAGLSRPWMQAALWALLRLPDPVLLPAARLAGRFTGTALRRVLHDPSVLPPEAAAEFRRESTRPGGQLGYLRYGQAIVGRRWMRNDVLPEVHRIRVPTLFFHGDLDPLIPPRDSRLAAARMPGARVVLASRCGHWAQLEAHDRFLTEVRGFLAGLD
ncbi:alpha/beta fold hydrolase [Nocardiopsis sp. CNT-189]|uniref:alpha/beta fold hydrolase n=1 Tax=Nocardiopsis oceanisediminis TaxID=2816862 RepID=UPI003B300F21